MKSIKCSNFEKEGEEYVYNRLRALLSSVEPEAYIIYQPFGNRDSDFIVFSPSKLGILLIEVKDWSSDKIIELKVDKIRHIAYGVNHAEAIKGKNYSDVLRNRQIHVINALSKFQLQHKTPIIPLIFFPNIERSAISHVSDLDSQKESAHRIHSSKYYQFLFKNELEAMIDHSQQIASFIKKAESEPKNIRLVPSDVELILNKVFNCSNDNLIPQVRGINSGVDGTIEQMRSLTKQDYKIEFLDEEQSEYVKKRVNKFYSIRGVAGSGKSVILLNRFKHIAETNPNDRVLFTYYTSSLDEYYKKMLGKWLDFKSHPNIYIMTFARLSKDFFRETIGDLEYNNRVIQGKKILDKIDSYGEYRQYLGYFDKVLIDEGQDFPPSWAEVIKKITKGNGSNKSITVVYDPIQNLSKTAMRDVLKNFGLDRRGSSVLNKVYRNTKEVYEYAESLIDRKTDSLDGSSKTIEFKRSDSHSLQIVEDLSEDEIIMFIQQKSRAYMDTYVIDYADIAIIYPSASGMHDKAESTVKKIVKNKSSFYNQHRTDSAHMHNDRYRIKFDDPSLKVLSVNYAKGLEFKVVFLINFDEIEDNAENRRALYVACTRAKLALIILKKKNSTIFNSFSI